MLSPKYVKTKVFIKNLFVLLMHEYFERKNKFKGFLSDNFIITKAIVNCITFYPEVVGVPLDWQIHFPKKANFKSG